MSRRYPKKYYQLNNMFLNWLRTSRSRFQFEPQVLNKNARHIHLRFSGVTSAIRPIFTQIGISINVVWHGKHWDSLGWFEISERKNAKGYYNNFVLPEWIIYYPTREELWVQESFEILLKWCNETLASNKWLAIYEYGHVEGGSTEAKLQKNDIITESQVLQELLMNLKPLQGLQHSSIGEKDHSQYLVQMIPLSQLDK